MEPDTDHQFARCPLLLQDQQLDPTAVTAEAGDFCHKSAQNYHAHSLFSAKHNSISRP